MKRAPVSLVATLLLAAPLLAHGAEPIANWTAPPYWTPPSARELEDRAFGREPLAIDALAVEALPSSAMPFVAITPCRLADTRGNGFTGSYGPPMLTAGGAGRTMTITGRCAIPSGALAVSFNVTVTNTQGAGFILAYPAGGTAPTVSTLNYVAGQTIANAAVIPLSDTGGATFVAGVSGTDLILDVNGYYAPASIVNSVNGLSGALTLAQGTNVTITPAGSTLTFAAASAPVTSVFGRTGAVTAASGDYGAAQVTNTPAGAIAATNVQSALNELDAEKSATSHTHAASALTGLTSGRVLYGGVSGSPAQSASFTWTDATSTLGVSGNADVSLLRLPATSATEGQLRIAGSRFLHAYGNGTFVGLLAGNTTATGGANVGVGSGALTALSAGMDNTAVGSGALAASTTASGNTAVGSQALEVQSFANSGTAWSSENTALGYQALRANAPTSTLSGYQNTAAGAYALASNSTGSFNVAVGHGALYSNTTAEGNVALGRGTLWANTLGADNTSVGDYALRANTAGSRNTAVGSGALYTQSYSNAGVAWSTENTAVGYQALYSNQPTASNNGYQNVAVGKDALFLNQTGSGNVALGHSAMYQNLTGSGNVAIGFGALSGNQNGTENIAIGDWAGDTETGSARLHIGSSYGTLIYGEFDNARVGINATNPTATLDVNGQVRTRAMSGMPGTAVCVDATGILTICPSDARLKKDVTDLPSEVDVLAVLGRLRGVAYSWDTSQERAKSLGSRREIGFLAQEVEEVLPHVVATGADGYRAVDYARLTAFLVEVTKAQQAVIESQGDAIRELQQEVRRLAKGR